MRALSLLILFVAAPVWAQDAPAAAAPAAKVTDEGAIDRRVRRLSDEMRSPFCPGKTIMTCTSSQAYTLRQEMRDMVVSGMDDNTIMDALAKRYGDDIRNPPQPWYTVIVPFLPFVFGGALVFWVFRRWRRGAITEAAPPTEAADSAALAKLRARVAAHDEE